MASILEQQVQSVVGDPRSGTNVPNSNRTYAEILSDPEADERTRQEVVESFRETYIKAPPVREQEVRALEPGDPNIPYYPPEAPTGGLQPGETVNEDGTLNYDPDLEATQSYDIEMNLGSLAGGKMTAAGVFLAGPARPGSPSMTFRLPPGVRPDEIPLHVYEFMVEKAQELASKEYQEASQLDSALKSGAVGFAREAAVALPTILDMPPLIARGVDYLFSPVGTNTWGQDIKQAARAELGLPDNRPRPPSLFLDAYPGLLESLGVFASEHPNTLFSDVPGMVVTDPDRELLPFNEGSKRLLDEVLNNLDMPGALTPQQLTDAQKNATFIGSVLGGSFGTSGAFRLGAKLAVKGMTVADLRQAGVLKKILYSTANSPGVSWVGGNPGRRFVVPGPDGRDILRGSAGAKFLAKDQALAATSAAAMLMTPDEVGPTGKLIAGLTAPLALSSAAGAIRRSAAGRALNAVGGFMEPFTLSGQRTLSQRFLANVAGFKDNEQLVVNLLSDLDNVPRRAGQDELITTPAYFDSVSSNLRQAESDWSTLRQSGVSDADAVAQLSQNAAYGRYFKEVSVFGGAEPTIEGLSKAAIATKLLSDNLYGSMAWLHTGSPIKNEALRAAGERMRRAEEAFKDLSRNFDGNPADARKYIDQTIAELEALARDSMQTHAVDAALFVQLKQRLVDAGGEAALLRNAADDSKVAVAAAQKSLAEMREIEKAFWNDIGATGIQIAPENMALIGDKAAEIILSTPVAQRNQIPPTLYQIAGTDRLLSNSALESMARAAGASSDVPASIIALRGKLAELGARRLELESRPYQSPALGKAQAKLSRLEAELAAIPKGSTIEDATVIGRINRKQVEIAGQRQVIEDLTVDTVNPALTKLTDNIAGQQAKLSSLEESLIPARTGDDELNTIGPNGILDNVDTLDEVLAARGALVTAAARARSRTGGDNAARLANLGQKYIIEDWLQNPEIFGDVGKTAAYEAARAVSIRLNDLYTRSDSMITRFLAQDATRGPKNAPETFLSKIIDDNKVDPNKRPTGSLEDLDAAMVEAKAPFLVRGDDGVLVVDRNAGLTPGLENITWESIRTTNGETVAGTLLREELLNRLALIGFDAKGNFQSGAVQKAVRSWDGVITRVEADFPQFRSELNTLINKGDGLVARSKALETMTKKELDVALATKNLDDIQGAQAAGLISRKAQADHTVAQVFLDNDPNVVAKQLLANPAMLENDIAGILNILDGDDSGRAVAGFKRAFFDQLTSSTLKRPETAGRVSGEAVLDPAAINNILTENETALRRLFSDRLGPPGSNMTTYDMIKLFNDEASAVMAERAGLSAGAKSVEVKSSIRGREMIRNVGRIAGVKVAGMTGGPALVMAGTGARLADNLLAQGNMSNVYALVADAVADPALAKLLLVDEATLTKAGRFNFNKKLAAAVKPYLFFAGRPAEVVRVGIDEQKERDRIQREGGETDVYYDEETDRYVRRPVGKPGGGNMTLEDDWQMGYPGGHFIYEENRVRYGAEQVAPPPQVAPSPPRRVASPLPPAQGPVAASALNKVNPVGPAYAYTQDAPPNASGTAARGAQLFPFDSIFAGLKDGGPVEGEGIMSVRRKPRQMVG